MFILYNNRAAYTSSNACYNVTTILISNNNSRSSLRGYIAYRLRMVKLYKQYEHFIRLSHLL